MKIDIPSEFKIKLITKQECLKLINYRDVQLDKLRRRIAKLEEKTKNIKFNFKNN